MAELNGPLPRVEDKIRLRAVLRQYPSGHYVIVNEVLGNCWPNCGTTIGRNDNKLTAGNSREYVSVRKLDLVIPARNHRAREQ
ncbi:MAG: hypothetical protein QOC81_1256 [Thermoanaerobaculia bacterium]|jgi:hypothetical protein|nr:hypothetical protein [Thermoanaerobaculia bacterium]